MWWLVVLTMYVLGRWTRRTLVRTTDRHTRSQSLSYDYRQRHLAAGLCTSRADNWHQHSCCSSDRRRTPADRRTTQQSLSLTTVANVSTFVWRCSCGKIAYAGNVAILRQFPADSRNDADTTAFQIRSRVQQRKTPAELPKNSHRAVNSAA